jgi:hypothetical protein
VDYAAERVTVAVVRAWVEPGEKRLKIRITAADHPTGGRRTVGVTTEIDSACAIVRAWLEAFLVCPGQDPMGPDAAGTPPPS